MGAYLHQGVGQRRGAGRPLKSHQTDRLWTWAAWQAPGPLNPPETPHGRAPGHLPGPGTRLSWLSRQSDNYGLQLVSAQETGLILTLTTGESRENPLSPESNHRTAQLSPRTRAVHAGIQEPRSHSLGIWNMNSCHVKFK